MTVIIPPKPALTPPTTSRLTDPAEHFHGAARHTELDGRFISRDIHDAIVKDAMSIADLYFDMNVEVWEKDVDYWGLYLGDKEDPRSVEEKTWRANIHSPRPKIQVEAKVAVHDDIMTSGRPIIQAEGVGLDDEGGTKIERLLEYQMKQSYHRRNLPPTLRAISIQGGEFGMLFYSEKGHTFTYKPTQGDYDAFRMACMSAIAKGAPAPMPSPVQEPAAFKVWQEYINKSGMGRIPDPPFAGNRLIRQYCGPRYVRVSKFDVWLDPSVGDLHDQQAIVHYAEKTPRWVMANAGDEAWQMFDPEAVARALDKNQRTASHSEDAGKYRRRINEILGVTDNRGRDPIWEDKQAIFTFYFAGEPLGEYPYVVVLNGEIINKNPRQMPFMHGQVPLFYPRNLTLPGYAHGLSDFSGGLESIFKENDAFRNLRLDGATLATFPILAKLASIAMPEMMRKLAPGMVVPVTRMDGLQQLFKIQIPEAAYREPVEMIRDAEDAMGTGANVQGQTATIGRIPATTDQSRLQSALSRLKLSIGQHEEDMSDFAFQSLAIWYEKGSEVVRVRAGGGGSDPYVTLSRSEIIEALEQDYVFSGSTAAINRDTMSRNLGEFAKAFGASLTPMEMRAIADEVIRAIGTRNAERIVSPEGTKDAKQAYDLQKQQALAQAAAGQQQAQMAAMRTPSSVGPGEMAALDGASGGTETAPSGAMGNDGGGAQ